MATVYRNVVNRASGHAYKNRLTAHLEGGPELARQLQRLDEEVRVAAAKEAIRAGGEPMERAWISKLPTGPEPVHMKEAVKLRVSKSKYGANATIAVRKVRGIDDDKQPQAYAMKLEKGGRDTAARPAARPAFDQHKDQAVDLAIGVLRRAIAGVAR